MTDADARRAARRIVRAAALGAVCAAVSGCATPSPLPAEAYYRYDFIAAREELRPLVEKVDNDLLLNELRLGMAGLADGNVNETEAALSRVFDLLSTAGLNKDRTAAAALVYEGVRIWKGEPFEQALAYYWVAAHYASRGDWENARAAAANALFRLTDFGADMTAEKVARKAATDESYLDQGYTAVDSNFALGFLMQAIGADLTGAGGAKEQFDAALKIDPNLGPVVDALRSRRFDTLLIVDYGRGPQKIAYGPDNALTKFVSRERSKGALRVTAGGEVLGELPVVCDVEQMAYDLRWNNLEDIRRAKSAIGDVLTIGGGTAAVIGGAQNSDAALIAGLGAVAMGLLLKASAQADVRYLDFAPSSIYLVPIRLNAPMDIELAVVGAPSARVVLPAFQPGTERAPRTVYLRLFGTGSPAPEWL
ncbi:MAG: hypothetical protein KDA22_14005, partial [Phycisphaerales bacterium]|nr:hypothetical protein [Phycisphaerales bacterium]